MLENHSSRSVLRTRLLTLILTLAGLFVGLLGTATPSSAAPSFRTTAVTLAAQQAGKPYVYGAVGPRTYDCSGLTLYVFKTRLRHNLPRTAQAQWRATIHIAKSQIRPGDLVFFGAPRAVYHVGIYAGGGKIWHAPQPGQRVKLSRIWTSDWAAGRVR